MKKFLEFIKSHVALTAIVLGIIILLVVGVVMALSKRGNDGKPVDATTTNGVADNDETTTEKSGEGVTEDWTTDGNQKETTPEEPTAVTEPSLEASAEDSKEDGTKGETEPVVDSPVDGTDAPTEAPETVAPTEPQTEAPTPAPTEPPTEAPKPAPTVPPTQAPKPMTDEEKLKEMGVTYSANSDGGVTITGGNLTGDVVIPATIDGKKVVLGELSFYENSAITSLVINCETIENYAFNDMDSLKSVVIGANVKTLGEAAFANCSNLESVTFLGEQITEFPQGLFAACPKLLSLTIPRSVTKVNASAFPEASCYLELVYGGNIPPLSTIDYSAIVPEFTLYAYNEPDLIYEDFIKYIEYENLEAGLKAVRMYNYKVVYR